MTTHTSRYRIKKGRLILIYPITQLYESAPEIELSWPLRPNPLIFAGALDEAEFIDMRISPQRSRAGILYDIRWCRNFEGCNTSLVILFGVGSVLWSNGDDARRRPWQARYGNWQPRSTEASFASWDSTADHLWASDAMKTSTRSVPDAALSDIASIELNKQNEYVLVFGPLSVSAISAQIYVGRIEGLDGAPPDMSDLPDAEIIGGFPQWSSKMEVIEHYQYPDPAEKVIE